MATEPKRDSTADRLPLVAVILTWFLPGAGHLYLGRGRTAAIGFGVVALLFILGVKLAEGRTFEFLDPELRSQTAIVLAPEVCNLGGLLWLLQNHPITQAPVHPGAFPPWIHLGSLLIALAGLANLGLIVDAHFQARGIARVAGPSPAVHAAAGWAIPGLGHVLQGRVLRGGIVFGVLVALFGLGTWLAEGTNLSRERHFYYWSAQSFLGLPAIGAELLSGRPPMTGPIARLDIGLFYAALAGLLNLLSLVDVIGFQSARRAGIDPGAERESTEATASKPKGTPTQKPSKRLIGVGDSPSDSAAPASATAAPEGNP